MVFRQFFLIKLPPLIYRRDTEMTEQDIIDTIRQYKYIPEKLLFKLFCNGCYDYVNDKNAKYLQRTLKRLTGEKKIEYHSDRNAYCVPLFSEEINRDLIKALWILTEFDVKEHYAGESLVLIIFMTSQNQLYEIVHLSSKTYRIVMTAINRNVDKRDMPKRIAIVDSDEEADKISDEVLHEINCVSLCRVDNDGNIESYEI